MRLEDAIKEWDGLDMDEGMEPEATLIKAARTSSGCSRHHRGHPMS